MEKPTQDQIIEYVKTRTYRKPIEVIKFNSIESFTLVYTYKKDAREACESINHKFGSWVYAMVHDIWRHPHVSIGYRSKELE